MTAKLSTEDLGDIRDFLLPDMESIFKKTLQPIKENTDTLVSNVDRFLKKSQDHDDEIAVLRAQTGRIRNVLVEKGVASEDELSVLGKSGPA